MKTTSRKRLLISSVAMLLVAMLALGTATFAWFTSNTTSKADDFHATTTKVSTLVISKNDKKWKTHVEYGVGTSNTEMKEMYLLLQRTVLTGGTVLLKTVQVNLTQRLL